MSICTETSKDIAIMPIPKLNNPFPRVILFDIYFR